MPDDFPVDVEALSPVLDRLNMGVYITDLDRRIILWNRKAEEITGHKAADVIGLACHENVLVHTDKDGHELCHSGHCPLYRTMKVAQESDTAMLVFAQTANGRRLAVSVSTAPLLAPDGTVIGGIEAFRDESGHIQDLEAAQKIQRNLLPEALPSDDSLHFSVRYYPRDMVGGDYYDVFPLRSGRCGVLLADVSGHGVSAALYTMQLKSIADAALDRTGYPGAFMAALNDGLARFVVSTSFATAIYALVDAQAGTVTYSTAGHPPGLLIPADGSAPVLLKGEGMPLGILADSDYEERTAPFQPGDSVVVYTDGATEVRNEQDEMLDTDGLASILWEESQGQRTQMLERVYGRVKEYCAEVIMPDDFTVLSVTREG